MNKLNRNGSNLKQINIEHANVIDQDVRDELLSVSESYIVQAPAGSGKTELLTQRILALLSVVSRPENILAITFTRKAASEMKERVISALIFADNTSESPRTPHELARWSLAKKVLERDKEKQWNLIANPNRLKLLTIDSLSANLTGALPLLSQTGMLPSIAENADIYFKQASQAMLEHIEDGDGDGDGKLGHISSHIKVLLKHKDNNLKQLVDLVSQLLAKRLQWLPRISNSDIEDVFSTKTIKNSLERIVEEKLLEIYSAIPLNIISELPPLLNQASSQLQEKKNIKNLQSLDVVESISLPSSNDLTLWKAIAELLLTATKTKPSFYKSATKTNGFPPPADAINDDQENEFKINKEMMKNILKDCSKCTNLEYILNESRYLPDVSNGFDSEVLESLLALLPLAVAHLKLVFKEHNVLDFSELSIASLNALGTEDNPTDIALAMDYRIEHILVDEFQDTSSPQIDLLKLLTSGWDYSSNKTLFLVGDPMQSIYRFRDANVSLFMHIAEFGIGQVHPVYKQLKVNFRSNENIIDWVNRQFQSIMPAVNDLTLSAVSYATSTAFQKASPMSFVKSYLTVDAEDNQDQANEILRVIQEHLLENENYQSGRSLKTLAILARSRNHLKEIIFLLNQNGIPYQAIDIEPLSSKMAVQDVVSLALALTDNYDQISWLACLRSPWFSLELDDMTKVMRVMGLKNYTLLNDGLDSGKKENEYCDKNNFVLSIPETISRLMTRSSLNDSLSDRGKARCMKLMPILMSAIEQKGKKPFQKWLYGCFEAVGGLLQVDMLSEVEDIKTCVKRIAEFENAGEIIDRAGLQESLDKLYASPNSSADNQIQIMTIHKSKGLEFDRVILPRLDAKSFVPDTPLMKWAEVISDIGGSQTLLAISKPTGENNDSVYEYIGYLDKQKEKYENQRLLYVATTRAKQELHLFGNIKEDTKKIKAGESGKNSFKRPIANSFLDMIWDKLEADESVDSDDSDDSGGFRRVKQKLNIIKTVSRRGDNLNLEDNKSLLPIDKPTKLSEYELSQLSHLETKQQQLEVIFPDRLTKRCDISEVEEMPVISAQEQPVSLEYWNDNLDEQNIASSIGTLIHRQLEWIAEDIKRTNKNNDRNEDLKKLEAYQLPVNWIDTTVNQLNGLNLDLNDQQIFIKANNIRNMLETILKSEIGQFILAPYDSADNELTLHKNLGKGIFHSRVIDRCFIVGERRWIVDYKSSTPLKNESIEEFIIREQQIYKKQLEEYVSLFKEMESYPITAGIYLLSINQFISVYES